MEEETIRRLARLLAKVQQPPWEGYHVIFLLREDDNTEQMIRDCRKAIEIRARERKDPAELLAIPFMRELAKAYTQLPRILRTLGFRVIIAPKDSRSGVGWDAEWTATVIRREWKNLQKRKKSIKHKPRLLLIAGGNIGHGKSHLLRSLKRLLSKSSECPEPEIILEPEERWIPMLTTRGTKNAMEDQEGLYTELIQIEVIQAEKDTIQKLKRTKPPLVIKERCMLECALTFIPIALAQHRLMGDFLQRLTLWPTPKLKPPEYRLVRMKKAERYRTVENARQKILSEYATLFPGKRQYMTNHQGSKC